MTPNIKSTTFAPMVRSGKAMDAAATSIVLAVCLIIVSGCPNGSNRNPRLSQKLYWLGQDYYNRAVKSRNKTEKDNFVRESMTHLERAVKRDGSNYLARNLLGYLLLHRADEELGMIQVAQCLKGEDATQAKKDADIVFRKAEAQFRKTVKLEPRCTNAWLGLANISMHFGDYSNAIKHARKVINTLLTGTVKTGCSSPGDKAVAWGNIGWAFFFLGDLVKASKNLRQAIFLQPKFYLGHYWLGRVHYARGEHEEALKALSLVVQQFGLPQAAHQYLGLVLLKLGRRQEAESSFRRCVKLAERSCTAEECRQYLKMIKLGPKGSKR